VWRHADRRWIPDAELGPGILELATPWRQGLLLIGTVHRPDGYNAAAWWSDDGSGWRPLTEPGDPVLEGVTFDGLATGHEPLVAYGRGRHDSGVWISPDGSAWQRSSLHGIIDLVASVPSGFVAFGRHPERRQPLVALSPDGAAWQSLPTEALFAFEGVSMATLVSFEGGLVAAGTDKMRASATVWVSDDGAGWLRAPFETQPGTSIEHLIVAHRRLLAVGSDAGAHRTGRPGAVAVWESTDAVNWERLPSPELFANAAARSVHVVGGSVVILGTLVAGYESPWPEAIPVTWSWEQSQVGAVAPMAT
jgi:hypothetical protein